MKGGMGGLRHEPIRSEFGDRRDLEERIDAFIVALGEQIDMIQEAECAGDLKVAFHRLRSLCEEARGLGFSPLVEAGRLAAESCEAGDAEAARERIVELTRVVQRVRLGHRGAT